MKYITLFILMTGLLSCKEEIVEPEKLPWGISFVNLSPNDVTFQRENIDNPWKGDSITIVIPSKDTMYIDYTYLATYPVEGLFLTLYYRYKKDTWTPMKKVDVYVNKTTTKLIY